MGTLITENEEGNWQGDDNKGNDLTKKRKIEIKMNLHIKKNSHFWNMKLNFFLICFENIFLEINNKFE